MELWRAVQFRDSDLALELIESRPADDLYDLVERLLVGPAAVAAADVKPDRLREMRAGSRATVLVGIRRKEVLGGQVSYPSLGTFRVGLIRKGGRWRVRVTPELTRLVRSLP